MKKKIIMVITCTLLSMNLVACQQSDEYLLSGEEFREVVIDQYNLDENVFKEKIAKNFYQQLVQGASSLSTDELNEKVRDTLIEDLNINQFIGGELINKGETNDVLMAMYIEAGSPEDAEHIMYLFENMITNTENNFKDDVLNEFDSEPLDDGYQEISLLTKTENNFNDDGKCNVQYRKCILENNVIVYVAADQKVTTDQVEQTGQVAKGQVEDIFDSLGYGAE